MKPRRKSWRMERETTALHQPVYCATAATTETTPPLPFSHSPASRGVLKPTIISVFHPKLLFIKDLLWRIPPLRPGPEPTKPVSLSLCCGWKKFSPPLSLPLPASDTDLRNGPLLLLLLLRIRVSTLIPSQFGAVHFLSLLSSVPLPFPLLLPPPPSPPPTLPPMKPNQTGSFQKRKGGGKEFAKDK